MPKEKEYTDEELKKALIEANGQPTKAAEMLGVSYVSVYGRIRKNPELLEIQKAYRAKIFNDVSNTMVFMAMAGIIKEPVTDESGNVIKGEFREVAVDYRTRLSAMQSVMSTFKSDEGITDKLDITTGGETINTGFKIEIIDKREDVKKEEESH